MANPIGMKQHVFVASDQSLSTGTLTEFPNLDVLSTVFEVHRLFITLTAAVDTAVVVEFKWRPDEGSATGEVTLATFTIPAGSAGDKFQVPVFRKAPSAATEIDAPGGSGGLAGSERFVGNLNDIIGPGGALVWDDDGASASGTADIWAEVLIHGFAGPQLNSDNQDVSELSVS